MMLKSKAVFATAFDFFFKEKDKMSIISRRSFFAF